MKEARASLVAQAAVVDAMSMTEAAMAGSTSALDEDWKTSRSASVTIDVMVSIAAEGVRGALSAMAQKQCGGGGDRSVPSRGAHGAVRD